MIDESGSEALRSAADGWERRAASALSRVEVSRALLRMGAELAHGRRALTTVSLLGITDEVLDTASRIGTPILRSLDAIHVASALSVGDELSAFVAYDKRLIAVAEEAGLPTLTPQ